MILRCFPRVHLGLMDMGNATPRRYGGAGFTVGAPFIEMSAKPATRIIITGLEQLDDIAALDIRAGIERLVDALSLPGIRLHIRRVPPQHVGLGTKTSLLLGALTATVSAYGTTPSKRLLQKISWRGGASGVGVNSFFTGGFVADAGHLSPEENPFAPSSARAPTAIPPIVSRARIPRDWIFFLVLPKGLRFFARQELRFFSSHTPIPKIEVLQSISILYHGIVPSVVTGDIEQLADSLSELHQVGFKKREVKGQSEAVRRILRELSRLHGCAAGLSSMGPLVYAIAQESNADVSLSIKELCHRLKADLIAVCTGRNRGFEIDP